MSHLEPQILAALPVAVLVFDDRACVAYTNPAAEKLFGYAPDTLRGTARSEVFPDALPPTGSATLCACAHDGARFWVESTATRAGALLVCTLRAVAASGTQRHPLYAVFEHAPIAMTLQRGPELVWELANPAFRALLGGADVVGKRMRDVLPDYARMSGVVRDVYTTGQSFAASEMPLRVVNAPGQPLEDRYFTVLCEPARQGGGTEVDGVFTLAMDVTALIESRRAAETLASQRASEVRERDDFISIAAHELRTPLTTIAIAAQRLAREVARPPREDSAERLTSRVVFLERQLERMARLVETLLDVSRFAKGELVLHVARADFSAVVAEVVERHRHDAERAGCELLLELESGLFARFDALRIEQVTTNLLLNALKYGAGKPIVVSTADAGPEVRLTVRDHGIGIAESDQARVFGRFERAVEAGTYGGLGLGLWIVREIVERHVGRIELVSEVGEGSSFSVILPKKPGHPDSSGSS